MAANSKLLNLYLTSLHRRPLRTKALTAGTLAGLQELAAQQLSGTSKGNPVDKRVLQMTAYGLFISGPLGHYLFDLLNRVFAGRTGISAKILQILAVNLILSPIQNSVYLAAMAIISGARTWAQVRTAVKKGLLPMMKISWVISPACIAFAQGFLPPQFWVPFFNLVGFIFGTYINTMTKKRRLDQQKQRKDE
ncbi:uncharacterized protein VTP21DRAFT_6300 [Calcarisporiella thermophila]|uniref:uncharacterized protein n=1 Tax=Calcarisporiella thermophila TaxID=911321 RepID=UPI003742AE6D